VRREEKRKEGYRMRGWMGQGGRGSERFSKKIHLYKEERITSVHSLL
jgi:hypothetical protein